MKANEVTTSSRTKNRLSKHARARMQQRAIPYCLIDAAVKFGRVVYNSDGTRKHILNRESLEKHSGAIPDSVVEAAAEKSKPVYVLCDAITGHMITAGYCTRPLRIHRRRKARRAEMNVRRYANA